MQERTVSTASGWPETTRDMTPADVIDVAVQLASLRDYKADGIFAESYEGNYWAAKASTCIAAGLARVYVVNRGGPCGAVLAQADTMNPGRAVLWACNSMWGSAAEAALLEDAKAWADSQGLQLGRMVAQTRMVPQTVREWQPL